MVTKKVKITCPNGIHLRPAGKLSSLALDYPCTIQLKKENRASNVKSVLSLLGSCTKQNDEVEIVCDGEEEQKALDMVVEFLEHME